MSDINKNIAQEPLAEWGGKWTEKKLDAFSKYVWSYLTIMKKYPYWETIYFDGFAGSGNRKEEKSELYKLLLFTEQDEKAYKGAAERVLNLKNNLSFNNYYFIDTNETSIHKLKSKLDNLPAAQNKNIAYKSGDANQWLLELANTMHSKKYAALIFLDPFGMQINWNSIATLQNTRSDIWILVPTGVIVNRLLDKACKLKHSDKLQSFFGLSEDDIKKEFYTVEQQRTLFGEEEILKKIEKPIEQISNVYVKQLKTIWKYVTEKPLRLENSKGVPIFHFVFASNNPNALKIASDIIKNV